MRLEILLLLLLLALAVALVWFYRRPRLNLTIYPEGNTMPTATTLNVGQTATATIAPTAGGKPDANVSAIVFSVVPAGAYTIAPGPNPLVAIYTAAVAGTGIVANVSAVNEAGKTITDSAPLPDVETLVADALNLTITTP